MGAGRVGGEEAAGRSGVEPVGGSAGCDPSLNTAASTRGMVSVKVLPLPNVLSTEMSPPSRLASSREMVRPRPVPP